MFSIPDFVKSKQEGRRISILTCYDAPSAAILAGSGVDAVLVGDSAAMVVHGMDSTIPITLDILEAHVRAVRAGAHDLCVIGDMPFLSTRLGIEAGTAAAGRFMVAGANAVKLEGLRGHEELIPHLIGSGIPVMGHLGLTPQSFNVFGGYKVQGKTEDAAAALRADALALESLGCFAIVFECVPSPLAASIAKSLRIPVIGIGAGNGVDGQVLVLHDILGLSNRKLPRFVRQYADVAGVIGKAAAAFAEDVRSLSFPSAAESYGLESGKEGKNP
jgi:3-methyl-2-oxobutanoate hydroxymethyltransferase